MTKYILHGGFTREENESNHAFFAEFMKNVPDNGSVLFVYFADINDEEIPEKFEFHSKMCAIQSPTKLINFINASEENFIEEVRSADAILFNGGSTNKLLKVLKTYPEFMSLVKGKTIAGSSAGAYALSAYGASHSEEVVRKGLGLVPLRVICHNESRTLPPSIASVKGLHTTAQDLEMVILKDYEWRVFTY